MEEVSLAASGANYGLAVKLVPKELLQPHGLTVH